MNKFISRMSIAGLAICLTSCAQGPIYDAHTAYNPQVPPMAAPGSSTTYYTGVPATTANTPPGYTSTQTPPPPPSGYNQAAPSGYNQAAPSGYNQAAPSGYNSGRSNGYSSNQAISTTIVSPSPNVIPVGKLVAIKRAELPQKTIDTTNVSTMPMPDAS